MFDDSLFSTRMEGLAEVKQYIKGLGIDVGCGTNRVHPHIMSLDAQPDKRYADACIVWNCKDLEVFQEQTFDFIFSSHCLEDFEDIPKVFRRWFSRLKVGGVMILLLPDMENGRYPRVEDGGNPSHRVNVGPDYFRYKVLASSGLPHKVLQIDTVSHSTATFDVVIQRTG